MATIPNDTTLKNEIIQVDYKPINKYNYKLTEEDKKAILIDYYISNRKDNIMNICNKYHISKSYLYEMINKYKKNNTYYSIVEKEINKSRQNLTKQVDALLMKTLSRLNTEIEKDDKDINISQLSTMFGILYDKNALEQGKATSNNAFNINIKIDK